MSCGDASCIPAAGWDVQGDPRVRPHTGGAGLPPKPTQGFKLWLSFPGSEGAAFRVCSFPKGKDGAGPRLPLKPLSEEPAASPAWEVLELLDLAPENLGAARGGLVKEFLWLPVLNPHHGVWRSQEQSWEQLQGWCLESTSHPPGDTGNARGTREGLRDAHRERGIRAGSQRGAGEASCRNVPGLA